jgi:hypothetical protein
MNPVSEAKRLLRHHAVNRTTYFEKANYEREMTSMKTTERELDDSKGMILDVCYVDSVKQLVFSSTHSYLFFMDASSGLKETFLMQNKRDDTYKMLHYVKTKYPQFGMYYCAALDILLTYPGEGSEHIFEMYDPTTRILKYQVMKHETKVLCLCELILDKAHPTKDHYFVSASLDKKVVMWPTAPMSRMVQNSSTKRLLRVSDIIDYEFRGNSHAIQALAYAPYNEILFGC